MTSMALRVSNVTDGGWICGEVLLNGASKGGGAFLEHSECFSDLSPLL